MVSEDTKQNEQKEKTKQEARRERTETPTTPKIDFGEKQ